MPDAHANFPVSQVAVAPAPAASGTSLSVQTGHGARFPATPFNAIICPVGALATPLNAEIVRVTARVADALTIARTQEGSSARTVQVGDLVYAGITAKTLTDAETSVGGVAVPLGAGAWVVPGLGTNWANYGSGYTPVAYLKDPLGFVHLRGVLTCTGIGAVIMFTLPAGFRPGARAVFSNVILASAALGRLDVDAAGNVYAPTTLSGSVITIDGAIFLAEN